MELFIPDGHPDKAEIIRWCGDRGTEGPERSWCLPGLEEEEEQAGRGYYLPTALQHPVATPGILIRGVTTAFNRAFAYPRRFTVAVFPACVAALVPSYDPSEE